MTQDDFGSFTYAGNGHDRTWTPRVYRICGDFDAAIKKALDLVKSTFRRAAVFYFTSHDGYALDGPAPFVIPAMTEPEREGSAHVWPADTLAEARKRYLDLHYNGSSGLPKWVAHGAVVRIKATPDLRRSGLRTHGGAAGNDRAWPKDVGTIERVDGNGYWDWRLRFDGGRCCSVDADTLAAVSRVRA